MSRLLLGALVVASLGCKGKAAPRVEPGPVSDRPAPMTLPERQRGADACTTYVERLCACAKQKPALAEQCELKHAKPEALALTLGVDDDPTSTRDSIVRAQREARKIIALCIQEAAQLPSLGCR